MTAKLTLADAIAIRVDHKRGKTVGELAEFYHVVPATITAIIARTTHSVAGVTRSLRKARYWHYDERRVK